MSDHAITWTHDGRDIVGKISCAAGTDAFCRQTCPNDCDEWDDDHECGLVDHGTCIAIESIEAYTGHDAGDAYCGSPTTVHDGPINVSWTDGSWGWHYADQPTPDASATR